MCFIYIFFFGRRRASFTCSCSYLQHEISMCGPYCGSPVQLSICPSQSLVYTIPTLDLAGPFVLKETHEIIIQWSKYCMTFWEMHYRYCVLVDSGLDSSSCAVQLKPSGYLASFHDKRQEDIELWSLPHMQLWGPIYWYKGPEIRHCLTETICHVKGLLQFLIPDSYNSRLHISFPHLMRVITVIDWLFEVTNLMGRGLPLHGGSPTWLVTLGN